MLTTQSPRDLHHLPRLLPPHQHRLHVKSQTSGQAERAQKLTFASSFLPLSPCWGTSPPMRIS